MYVAEATLVGGFFYAFVPLVQVLTQRAPALPTLGTLVLGVPAWLALALATAYEGLRCDDSCEDGLPSALRSSGWRRSETGWQWTAQLVLALVGFCCMLAAVHFMTRRQYRRAVSIGVVGLALYAGWIGLLASGNA